MHTQNYLRAKKDVLDVSKDSEGGGGNFSEDSTASSSETSPTPVPGIHHTLGLAAERPLRTCTADLNSAVMYTSCNTQNTW